MSIINFQLVGRVGHVLIDRPDRRNAINRQALDELAGALDAIEEGDIAVLVISGAQDQFCSGADLKELEDLEFTRVLRIVLDRLAALPFPTIAAISGACMGLGMQLAMSCDLRIATPDARFAVPVAKLGLMVDHWTVQRLALLAGHSTARQMLLTAQPITAERAYQVGFVQDLVGVDDAPGGSAEAGSGSGALSLTTAMEVASKISRLAPLALAGSKLGLDLLERSSDSVDPTALYTDVFTRAWTSADLAEGQLAFSERRSPEFRGR